MKSTTTMNKIRQKARRKALAIAPPGYREDQPIAEWRRRIFRYTDRRGFTGGELLGRGA